MRGKKGIATVNNQPPTKKHEAGGIILPPASQVQRLMPFGAPRGC
jgi:hypothetical protein